MSYSFSRSSGQSSSTPSNMYSSQSALAQQLAALDAALGQQTYNWAAQTYAADTAMTQQSVQNYLQMSQLGLGLAQQNLQDYNNIYRPEMAQLANEAGSYSSAARQQVNMGAAEAQSEAGSQAGLQAAQQQLQGYGINPNSGMYAELLQSQQAAAGAAAAGAGQEAGLATQNTGRQLLQASLQQGDQLPAAAVNALNSAYQGVAGAENSTLANANTGVNLFDAANPYMQTAMQLKYPPIGNTQQATNSGISNSNSQPPSNARGNNNSSSQGSQAPGAIPGQPNQHLTQPGPGNYNNENYGGRSTGGGGSQANGLGLGGTRNNPYYTSGSTDPFGGVPTDAFGSTSTASSDPFGGAAIDPFSSQPDFSSGVDPFSGGGFGGGDTSSTDTGGINPVAASMGDVTGSIPSQSPDMSSSGSTYTPQSTGSTYTPSSGGGGGYGGYARGGRIRPRGDVRHGIPLHPANMLPASVTQRMLPESFARGGIPTTGGHVPRSASPSQGRQTDDIPARLNADEFVVPRDVTKYYGHKFFIDLIKKSRTVTGHANPPARPSMKPMSQSQMQHPRFVSRPMGR